MRSNNIDILKSLGLFTAKEAEEKIGVCRQTLSRWARAGVLQRVDRGLYKHPDSDIAPDVLDFAVACSLFGKKSAIGGLTALFHYGLIGQVPGQVWIVVETDRKSERTHQKFKCIRTNTPIKNGVEKKRFFSITSIERTILESLKFASKIGSRIAIGAARKALHDGLTTEKKLGKSATELNMKNILEKYWEPITS